MNTKIPVAFGGAVPNASLAYMNWCSSLGQFDQWSTRFLEESQREFSTGSFEIYWTWQQNSELGDALGNCVWEEKFIHVSILKAQLLWRNSTNFFRVAQKVHLKVEKSVENRDLNCTAFVSGCLEVAVVDVFGGTTNQWEDNRTCWKINIES